MSSYWDWLNGSEMPSFYSGGSPFRLWHSAMDYLYETSHGAARYWLSQLPLTGRSRQVDDTARRWQDQYENTGIDPEYSDTYGSAGRSFINDMSGGIPLNPAKMAKTLSKMYGAEVALDVARERHAAAREWRRFQEMKNYGKMNK